MIQLKRIHENVGWDIGLTSDGKIKITVSTPEEFICSLNLSLAAALSIRDRLTDLIDLLEKDLKKSRVNP